MCSESWIGCQVVTSKVACHSAVGIVKEMTLGPVYDSICSLSKIFCIAFQVINKITALCCYI